MQNMIDLIAILGETSGRETEYFEAVLIALKDINENLGAIYDTVDRIEDKINVIEDI